MSEMDIPLKNEFDFYLSNQQEFVEKYNGKVIVIKSQELIGVYDSLVEAIDETKKTHKLGTFLVQEVEPGTNAYTQTYHSRVIFS